MAEGHSFDFVSHRLEVLQKSHHYQVRSIYEDAVENQGSEFYSSQQKTAWSSLAWLPGVLDQSLAKGKGWVSFHKKEIVGFAVRYPLNRLALLYCRGEYMRRGHATALLSRVEEDAQKDGESRLFTEASFCSYPLLLRNGWTLDFSEAIEIAGVSFDRFRMQKKII